MRLFIILLLIPTVYAISVGVSPSEVVFQENENHKQIRIFNPNDYEMKINLVSSEDILIDKRTSTINPHESIIRFINITDNLIQGTLSIQMNDESSLSPGIMVPVRTNKQPENELITYNIQEQKKIKKERVHGSIITLGITMTGLFVYLSARYLLDYFK